MPWPVDRPPPWNQTRTECNIDIAVRIIQSACTCQEAALSEWGPWCRRWGWDSLHTQTWEGGWRWGCRGSSPGPENLGHTSGETRSRPESHSSPTVVGLVGAIWALPLVALHTECLEIPRRDDGGERSWAGPLQPRQGWRQPARRSPGWGRTGRGGTATPRPSCQCLSCLSPALDCRTVQLLSISNKFISVL